MSSANAAAALADHAEVIRTLGKRAFQDIVEIGRRLIEAKKICGHGKGFDGWSASSSGATTRQGAT